MAKILIVDDDKQMAASLAQELNGHGHTCAVRARGQEALDVAQNLHLDLMVLDVMLPDVSGFEVCRRIRRDGDLYSLPIVFLSSMSSPEEIEHGLEQGADAYITKPFEPQQLVSQIERLLRTSVASDYVDRATNLPDAEGTRRRIHQFITREQPFALIYVEMLHLRKFAADAGEEGKNKALRHMARAMNACGENMPKEDFFVGHLGEGYFICATPVSQPSTFCEKVQRGWHQHVGSLYESVGLDPPKGGALELVFCVTACDPEQRMTAQQFLDTLSRIRRTIGDVSQGTIQVDRRI